MYINVYKGKKWSNNNFYIHLLTFIYIFLHLYTFLISIGGSLDPYYQKHSHQWHYTLHYFYELQTKSYILDVIGRFYSFSVHHKCCLSTICRFHSLTCEFSHITMSQFLQYNTTFTHNPFLSVIEALTFFWTKTTNCFF